MEQKVMWVAIAFRYGTKENVFPIGIFTDEAIATEVGKEYKDFRGGKYEVAVYPLGVNEWDDKYCGISQSTLFVTL